MATNGDRVLRDAQAMAEDMELCGEHRRAEIIRALCRTYEQSRRTNSTLHADNAKLRSELFEQRRAA